MNLYTESRFIKILFFVVLFFIITKQVFSQNNVGFGTTTPHPSAILDLTSTEKGLLLPRLTQAQRDSIDSPALSLIIYNLTSKCFEIWVQRWQSIWCYDISNCPCCFSFVDTRDSNIYHYVKIGSQIWMCENLKYLPSVLGPDTASFTTPYYYVYGYNGTNVTDAKVTSNYITYGVLYNWPAAMNSSASSNTNPSGVQGVCPAGWHLPSDAEWTQLTNYVGGVLVASGKLRETGITHWFSPNNGATNDYGFTALPGGYRVSNGTFINIGIWGIWWSASAMEDIYMSAFYHSMIFNDIEIYNNYAVKEMGLSVRCIRD